MTPKLIFTSVIYPGPAAEIDSLLLAESLRAFGGALAGNPLWLFMPHSGQALSEPAQKRLQVLDVRFIPFEIEAEKLRFFFMGQLAGLAQVEAMCSGQADLLAWLDANTLLLHAPDEFLLPHGKILGYRPVHHRLLGSRFDQPLDPFWEQVYRSCHVPAENAFPMRPVVEEDPMRPYFNAGILVTRPERGLLRLWYETFQELYQTPEFQVFYQQDARYPIFMHQAMLAGVVLRELKQDELQELPPSYNYPMHLWEADRTTRRPASMDELVTFRHEGFYEDRDWADKIPASDRLKQWLAGLLTILGMRKAERE